MSATDSGLFDPIFANEDLLTATSDAAWVQAMLRFEAALAEVSGRVGAIPKEAADQIAAACQSVTLDPAALGRAGRAGGNPVIPMVTELRAVLPPEASDWVHFGATSQDTLDTALMMMAREVTGLMLADLDRLVSAAASLAARYRSTPIAARTLLQQAGPTTFGAKAARWLVSAGEAAVHLDGVRRRRLAVQLGGAAGTLAALGAPALTIVDGVAAELGLDAPLLPWHTDRSRVAELAGALGICAGVAGKVALDVSLMSQTEVAEVREAHSPGQGASSALPHKRNPVRSVAVIASSRRSAAMVQMAVASMLQEHERAAGAWHAEWQTMRALFRSAGGAVAGAAEVLEGLEVDPAAMAANLARTKGVVMAERVVWQLVPSLGYEEARRLVEEATGRAISSNGALVDALPTEVAESLPADVFDPVGWLGSAEALVDRALAQAAQHEHGRSPQTGQPPA